jgi:hypothetical protein
MIIKELSVYKETGTGQTCITLHTSVFVHHSRNHVMLHSQNNFDIQSTPFQVFVHHSRLQFLLCPIKYNHHISFTKTGCLTCSWNYNLTKHDHPGCHMDIHTLHYCGKCFSGSRFSEYQVSHGQRYQVLRITTGRRIPKNTRVAESLNHPSCNQKITNF